jgi:hypothetical protein
MSFHPMSKIVITSLVLGFLITAISFASHPDLGWVWRISIFAGCAMGIGGAQWHAYINSDETDDEN